MKDINRKITKLSLASLLAVNFVNPIVVSATTEIPNSKIVEENTIQEKSLVDTQQTSEDDDTLYKSLDIAEVVDLTGTFKSDDEYRNVYNIDSKELTEISLDKLQNTEFKVINKIEIEKELFYFVELESGQIMWLNDQEIILDEESDIENNDDLDIEKNTSEDIQEENGSTMNESTKEETVLEKNSNISEAIIQEENVENEIANDEFTENQVRIMSSNVSSNNIQYQITIKEKGYSIDTVPWGNVGYKKVGDSSSYINKKVNVLKETTNGAYANISIDGKELGWIDKRAFGMVAVQPYQQTIILSGYSIDSAPWGSPGYYKISDTIDQIFNEVTIVGESTNRAYVYVAKNGVGIGWIDKKALGQLTVIDKKVITSETHSIDSAPWGQSGYKQLTTSKTNLYKEVDVMLKSANGAYSLIRSNGKYLGWIDNRALNKKTNRMTLSIVKSNHSIDTLPWGEKGYARVASSAAYLHKRVEIVAESNNGAYYLITINGKQLGWIDKKAFSINADSYPSVIISNGYSIDTLPWGTSGSQKVSQTDNYLSKNVNVVAEDNNGSYLLLVENGRELGWVDHRALGKAGNVSNSVPVDYTTSIVGTGYSIDTLPWGIQGYKNINSSNNLLGTAVKVSQHYNGYALIEISGAKYGWVDQKALANAPRPQNAIGQKNVYYNAVIRGNYSIDTLPWGTKGYQKLSHTSLIGGKKVKVLKITEGYAFINLDGIDLGWVDQKALGNPVVYIDPGHGGQFPGATANGVTEKSLNLSTAKILNDMLKSRGYQVVMTRTVDGEFSKNLNTDLSTRSRVANSGNAAIFISIHYNSMGSTNGSAKGIETFIQHSSYTQNRNDFNVNDPRINSSLRLADTTHNKILSYTGMINRGVRAQNLNVLRNTDMTAVLYELGFMSNTAELARIRTKQYQETAARAIADGIDQYFMR
ncbi:GW dipeptide domain-containing protein [Marinilactibacillus psychrotolerans]|uniref:GW dipeptide domain-containing protein n=1 Tax=Marinilactibacillus psychrotolerans TaxID=191770 RepID=UPI00388B673F